MNLISLQVAIIVRIMNLSQLVMCIGLGSHTNVHLIDLLPEAVDSKLSKVLPIRNGVARISRDEGHETLIK